MTFDFQQFKTLVKQVKTGKQLPDAVYVHESALNTVPNTLHGVIKNVAKALKINDEEWNLVKFYKRDFKVAFLSYPQFESYA